ncbi:MAG: glycosyltransferase family 39 protein [Planctomycetes bacterium]|nr:glycosyltransferase family 39 protein [Planctomycetota bacterium]
MGIVSVFAGYLAMHRIRGMIFLERVVLGFAAGLAGLVMAVFLAGVAGIMHPALMNMVLPSLSALMILFRAKWVVAKTQDEQKPIKALRVFAADFGPADWVLVGMIVVLSTVVLYGAAAPCVEYDTMEYHAAIPAEWHRAGGIVDLPHNVYSYFPMAVEMLYFAGISWVNDVALGAMVGKILAASCTVWAALALVCVGRRLFTLRAGLIAAVFYLTVPWVLRVSILGFVEGVQSFYVAAALLCTVVLWQRGDEEAGQDRRSIGPALLLGVIVGMTLGIKLTSAVFILPPILVLCFSALATRRIGWRALAAFAIATAAFGSPFYIRDLVLTGNPFFPVLSTWLGGPAGWTDEMARHFTEHHSAGAMTWRALTASLVGVQDAPPNTWPSFLFGGAVLLAAPFSLANRRWRRSAATLLVIVVVAVATWFCLTHRIMRHLAPAWVLLAMTGGAGLVAFRATWARWVLAVAVALHLGMTFMVDQRMLQDRGTYVSLLADAAAPMTDSGYAFTYHPDSTDRLWTYSPHVVRMINDLKRGRKFPPVIGLVGEARTLYFDVPVVYNTVFNRHWMEPLYREAARPDELKARALRLFQELGTTHVYINWAEVDRFRAPGNYGWPDGLDRDLFDRLEAAGVLNRILAVGRPEEPPLHVVYEVGSPH